jgi:hypothetical protein
VDVDAGGRVFLVIDGQWWVRETADGVERKEKERAGILRRVGAVSCVAWV